MEATQAIILAGGLGTRLRSAVPDLPKCMAPVAGRPFLYYVINSLRSQGITSFIFSLGYRHEVIEKYLADEFAPLDYKIVVEQEPLGTGGAIRLACTQAATADIFIANGDTLFEIQAESLWQSHIKNKATCTLALKPMQHFERYGAVETDEQGKIISFKEKQYYEQGNINGGIYLLHVESFLNKSWPEKFSFEKDFLEKEGNLFALEQQGYFIDIGIPGDYQQAQADLARKPLHLSEINKSWSLFLDRDGVINEDKPGSYIFSPDEFYFMQGAPALFKTLSVRFGPIIIATNQRGVGRGLMTEETLHHIHNKMARSIHEAGGRIDAICYATGTDNKDPMRKPNPGMAMQAKKQLPAIDFRRSIMVGNNISDMQFGRQAGMYTVFLTTTNKSVSLPHPDIDLIFSSLEDFVKAL